MRLKEFKQLNAAKGLHWFDKGTMRFFNSRILDFDCISGYFISSEKQLITDQCRYTIRKADFKTGNVTTIGEFCEYSTLNRARTALKKIRHSK